MYIYAVDKNSIDIKEFMRKINSSDWMESESESEIIDFEINISMMLIEIYYFRKAHNIHRWFVENIQNNIDDCGYYLVNSYMLPKLLNYIDSYIVTFEEDEALSSIYREMTTSKSKIERIIEINKKNNIHLIYHSSW